MLAANKMVPGRLATVSICLLVLSYTVEACFARAPDDKSGEIVCRVEGPSTNKSILPAGSVVQKGQLVCQLDSTALHRGAGRWSSPSSRDRRSPARGAGAREEYQHRQRLRWKEIPPKEFKDELEEAKKDRCPSKSRTSPGVRPAIDLGDPDGGTHPALAGLPRSRKNFTSSRPSTPLSLPRAGEPSLRA